MAAIGWIGWSYSQSGIVATIAHERDHEGRAVEHFLPSGPFALLPLAPGGALGHRTSIVWTEREENVPHLLALDPEDQRAEVERRFGLQLGAIALETPLRPIRSPSASPGGSARSGWRSSAMRRM